MGDLSGPDELHPVARGDGDLFGEEIEVPHLYLVDGAAAEVRRQPGQRAGDRAVRRCDGRCGRARGIIRIGDDEGVRLAVAGNGDGLGGGAGCGVGESAEGGAVEGEDVSVTARVDGRNGQRNTYVVRRVAWVGFVRFEFELASWGCPTVGGLVVDLGVAARVGNVPDGDGVRLAVAG